MRAVQSTADTAVAHGSVAPLKISYARVLEGCRANGYAVKKVGAERRILQVKRQDEFQAGELRASTICL